MNKSWMAIATESGIQKRSLIVAAIVGSVLNLINQGDVLVNGGAVDILKICLTFCVPYCVATYGAVSARLSAAAESSQ